MNRDEIDKTERIEEGMEVEEQVGGATTVARNFGEHYSIFKPYEQRDIQGISVIEQKHLVETKKEEGGEKKKQQPSMAKILFRIFQSRKQQNIDTANLEKQIFSKILSSIFNESSKENENVGQSMRAISNIDDDEEDDDEEEGALRRTESLQVGKKALEVKKDAIYNELLNSIDNIYSKKFNYTNFKHLLILALFKIKILAILSLFKIKSDSISIRKETKGTHNLLITINVDSVKNKFFFDKRHNISLEHFQSEQIFIRLKNLGVIDAYAGDNITQALSKKEQQQQQQQQQQQSNKLKQQQDGYHQNINDFLQKCNEIKIVYDTKYRDSYQTELQSNPAPTDDERKAAESKARKEAAAAAAAAAEGIVQESSSGVYQGTILTDKVVTLKTDFTFNTVDLSGVSLGYFPRYLLYAEGLTELNLSGCGLTYIPDDIDKLSSVKILDLSNNEIRSVPDSMTALAYTADVIDLRGNLLCREVPGQMVMEPVLPVDTVEAYQSRMDQEIKTHEKLLAEAQNAQAAAARAASREQQEAAQKRLESLRSSNFQIQEVTKYFITPNQGDALDILPLIQSLNEVFKPQSGIDGAPDGIGESNSGEILAENQIYIGTVIKLKITQIEASGGSTSPPSDKHLLFTPLILDTFPQKPENQIYELYQQSIESKQSSPATAPQPNENEQAYADYQSCERLESRIESYTGTKATSSSSEPLINNLNTDNANNYIDAYAELMSICKEYNRLFKRLDGQSFPGAEECPGTIPQGSKFYTGYRKLNINQLYKKWLVALSIIHAKTLTVDNSIDKNALLHLNFANMLGRDAYLKVVQTQTQTQTQVLEKINLKEVRLFLKSIKIQANKKYTSLIKNKYIKQKIKEQENNQKIGEITSFLNKEIQPPSVPTATTSSGEAKKPLTPPKFTDDNLKNVDIDLRLKYLLRLTNSNFNANNELVNRNIKVSKDELIDTFGMTQKVNVPSGQQSASAGSDPDTTKRVEEAVRRRGEEFNIITDVLNGIIQRQIDLVGTAGTGGITSATDDYSIRLNIIKFILKNRNLFENLKVTSFTEESTSSNEVTLGELGNFTIDSFDKVKLGFGLVSHIFELKDELGSGTVQAAITNEGAPKKDLSAKIEPLRYLINNIQLLAKAFPDTPALQVNKNHGAIQKCMEQVKNLLEECWGKYSSNAATEDLENIKLKNTLEGQIMNLQGELAKPGDEATQAELTAKLTAKQAELAKLKIPYILEYFNMLTKMPARPAVGTAPPTASPHSTIATAPTATTTE